MYRSPRSRVPWWGSVVINRAPLFFLISSVVAFSGGLVCFTYSSFPSTSIPIVITICTSVSSFTLLIVIFWFAGERWAYSHTNGKQWFTDVISETFAITKLAPTWHWMLRVTAQMWKDAVKWSTLVSDHAKTTFRRLVERPPDVEAPRFTTPRHVTFRRAQRPNGGSGSIRLRATTRAPPLPKILVTSAPSDFSAFSGVHAPMMPRPTLGLSTIVPTLRQFAPSSYLHEHPSPIRHLAFSPTGDYLASCSWDNIVIIWKVGSPFEPFQRLEHKGGAVGHVSWSPNGKHLLAKLNRSIVLWNAMVRIYLDSQ